MYPATSRRRSTEPHDANGTNTVTRAAASGRCRGPTSTKTNAPAINGPIAETRNAAFHPARGATAPASARESAVPIPNDAV